MGWNAIASRVTNRLAKMGRRSDLLELALASRAYDPLMDAKHMLERVATLKQEMQNLHVANARLDEPRWKKGSYEARLSRLEEIKAELAEMLYEFKRTGTD